jgi:arginyl-tRNA--protein-N-Asp/Glu arginylyltransferase
VLLDLLRNGYPVVTRQRKRSVVPMNRTAIFLSPPSPCPYLPDRASQLRYEIRHDLSPRDYEGRLRAGWRRFGDVVFRPECPSCRSCQSLRVAVRSFTPNQSQRRAWRRNAEEVTIRVGTPSISSEKRDLLASFHRYGQHMKGWPEAQEDNLDLFVHNPFRTEEWNYYLGERLIAVGYVDALSEGLSAIYFFWDPAERQRSLGTFNILTMIAAARERDLLHVYLGFYVEGCRSLEYKGRFRPNEVLGAEGEWTAFC